MSNLGSKNKSPLPSINIVSEPPKAQEQASITTMTFSGPVPPPNILTQYEQMVPGIAKKFLEAPH